MPRKPTKGAAKGATKRKTRTTKRKSNDQSYWANIEGSIPVVQYGTVSQLPSGVSLNWRKPRTSKRFETIIPNGQLIAAKIADEESGGFVVRMVKQDIIGTAVSQTEVSNDGFSGVDENGNGVFINGSLATTVGLNIDYTSTEEV